MLRTPGNPVLQGVRPCRWQTNSWTFVSAQQLVQMETQGWFPVSSVASCPCGSFQGNLCTFILLRSPLTFQNAQHGVLGFFFFVMTDTFLTLHNSHVQSQKRLWQFSSGSESTECYRDTPENFPVGFETRPLWCPRHIILLGLLRPW